MQDDWGSITTTDLRGPASVAPGGAPKDVAERFDSADAYTNATPGLVLESDGAPKYYLGVIGRTRPPTEGTRAAAIGPVC